MPKNKFSMPPLSKSEKEKKAEEFINFSEKPSRSIDDSYDKRTIPVKEKTKSFLIRLPESLWHDLQETKALTGLSINAICLELIRPGVKEKLKEIKS